MQHTPRQLTDHHPSPPTHSRLSQAQPYQHTPTPNKHNQAVPQPSQNGQRAGAAWHEWCMGGGHQKAGMAERVAAGRGAAAAGHHPSLSHMLAGAATLLALPGIDL